MTRMSKEGVVGERLGEMLSARLEARAQPWASVGPVDIQAERGSDEHRGLVAAGLGLLLGLGARCPTRNRSEPSVDAAAGLVGQWLEFRLHEHSLSGVRTSVLRVRAACTIEVEQWSRLRARLMQRGDRPGLVATYSRASRKLALRRVTPHRVRATHALLHMVRSPSRMHVETFIREVSRAAAAAEVVALFSDTAALKDIANLGWLHAALTVREPKALETTARLARLAALVTAEHFLLRNAGPVFAASAVMFIDWLLGDPASATQLSTACA